MKTLDELRDDELIDDLNLIVGSNVRYRHCPKVIGIIKNNYDRYINELEQLGMPHTAEYYKQEWNRKVEQ